MKGRGKSRTTSRILALATEWILLPVTAVGQTEGRVDLFGGSFQGRGGNQETSVSFVTLPTSLKLQRSNHGRCACVHGHTPGQNPSQSGSI